MCVSRNVTHLTAYNSFFQNLQSAEGGGGGGFRIPQKKKTGFFVWPMGRTWNAKRKVDFSTAAGFEPARPKAYDVYLRERSSHTH
jgi:hypothetical protein